MSDAFPRVGLPPTSGPSPGGISMPSASTLQAQDDSAARVRADLQRLRDDTQNQSLIFEGLQGLAGFARERLARIGEADALMATDRAHTDLVTAALTYEREIADSHTPDQAAIEYWEQYDTTVNELVSGLPNQQAQRAFMGAANQFKRSRIGHVLDVAEARTGELMIGQLNTQLSTAVKNGDVRAVPELFKQYREYLRPEVFTPGGALDQNVARAQERRVEKIGRGIYNEQGAGAAATWFLDPENTPGRTPDQRRGYLRMVDSWQTADRAALDDAKATEMQQMYAVIDEMKRNGRDFMLMPDVINQMADQTMTSYDPIERATLVAKLNSWSGADTRLARHNELREEMAASRLAQRQSVDDYLEERRVARGESVAARIEAEREWTKNMAHLRMETASGQIQADQAHDFIRWARELQVAGLVDQVDAERWIGLAQGAINEHRQPGVDFLKQHFKRLQIRNYALELGDGYSMVGGKILDPDGTQVQPGDLDGMYLDVVHADGRAGRLYIATEQARLIAEYERQYQKATSDSGQVPQDPSSIAMQVWDQFLFELMPGDQQGEVISGAGAGPQVYYPGSGLSGAMLFPDDAEAITEYEGRFGRVRPGDLGDALGEQRTFTFEDSQRLFGVADGRGKAQRRSWFTGEAHLIHGEIEERGGPLDAEIGMVSRPAFAEQTGQYAMEAAGVFRMSSSGIDEELLQWQSMMQAGRFDLAGAIAVRRLPADQNVLQGLKNAGAISAYQMVPGRGALVKLLPFSEWVPTPLNKPLPWPVQRGEPIAPTQPVIPVPSEEIGYVEQSSREQVLADEEARVDRLLGADIETDGTFGEPQGQFREDGTWVPAYPGQTPPGFVPTQSPGEGLREAWNWWTGGDLTDSSTWQQTEGAREFGGKLEQWNRNLWGGAVVDTDATPVPEDPRWPLPTQSAVYDGWYSVKDVTETALDTVRLWMDGGQGVAVQESAAYLQDISRSARRQMRPSVVAEIDHVLGQYRDAQQERQLDPAAHRPDLPSSYKDLPTSLEPKEMGGLPDAKIGTGYSGIRRVTTDEMGWRQSGQALTFPGPPAMGRSAPAMGGHPSSAIGARRVGSSTVPSRPAHPTGPGAAPGEPGAAEQQYANDVAPGAAGEPTRPANPTGPGARRVEPDVPDAPRAPQETGELAVALPSAVSQARPDELGEPRAAQTAPQEATAEPGRPAAPAGPGSRQLQPGEPEFTQRATGETAIPPMPADPSIAWESPPAFESIGVDTGGAELYVLAEPQAPDAPAVDAAAVPEVVEPRPPAGRDRNGAIYGEPDLPENPVAVVRHPGDAPGIAVPIGVNANGRPVFHVIREPLSAPGPEVDAKPGEPGYPQRIHSNRLSPDAETEPARPADPEMTGGAPGEGTDPGTSRRPYSRRSQAYEPSDLPEAPEYGSGERFMDRPPLEPRDMTGEETFLRETDTGAPFPDRRLSEPRAPREQEEEPRSENRHYGGGQSAGPGMRGRQEGGVPPQPGASGPSAAPDVSALIEQAKSRAPGQLGARQVEPDVPGLFPTQGHVDPSQPPPVQEYMARVSASGRVEARAAAHRLATDTMHGGALETDAQTVAQAVLGMDRVAPVPPRARDLAQQVADGEVSGVALGAWYLNHHHPEWNWWDEDPEWTETAGGQQAATNAPIRELPTPQQWGQNPQMQQFTQRGEGRAAGDIDAAGQLQPYDDNTGRVPTGADDRQGEPTIGFGSRWIYGRRENGQPYIAGTVDWDTRLPRDLPASEDGDQTPEDVAQSQLELGIEFHYGEMVRAFESRDALDALEWLNDSQLAALTDMTFNRGAGAMTRTPSGRALIEALQARDLDAINRAWWPTFGQASAIGRGDVAGLNNRRSQEAALFFHGWPENINQQWKDQVPYTDDIYELRMRALHRGVTPDSGHLVTAGHRDLHKMLPTINEMPVSDRVSAWGMDALNPNRTYLWITGKNGAVPDHLREYVTHTRRHGPNLIYFLSASATA